MLSRVREITVNMDQMEDLREEWPRYPGPLAGTEAGLWAAYLFVDPDTGKGLSMTIWEDEASMKASEGSPEFEDAYGAMDGMFTEHTKTYYNVVCACDGRD